MPIQLKRAYDEPEESDGIRILVDRLWPRGVSKEKLQLDEWMKEVAPSDELRKNFCHDPDKFEGFRKRYFKQLDGKEELTGRLTDLARDNILTLVYGAKDRKHNQAVVLQEYLENKLA